jgi:hypothetical protein
MSSCSAFGTLPLHYLRGGTTYDAVRFWGGRVYDALVKFGSLILISDCPDRFRCFSLSLAFHSLFLYYRTWHNRCRPLAFALQPSWLSPPVAHFPRCAFCYIFYSFLRMPRPFVDDNRTSPRQTCQRHGATMAVLRMPQTYGH